MKILNTLTLAYVANTLVFHGFRGKIENHQGIYLVETATEGWSVSIHFPGHDLRGPDEEARSFQFSSCWQIENKSIPLVKDICNEINYQFRFTKAFVLQNSGKYYAEITLDHLCPEGLAQETLLTLLSLFTDVRRRLYFACRDRLADVSPNTDNFGDPDLSTEITAPRPC